MFLNRKNTISKKSS